MSYLFNRQWASVFLVAETDPGGGPLSLVEFSLHLTEKILVVWTAHLKCKTDFFKPVMGRSGSRFLVRSSAADSWAVFNLCCLSGRLLWHFTMRIWTLADYFSLKYCSYLMEHLVQLLSVWDRYNEIIFSLFLNKRIIFWNKIKKWVFKAGLNGNELCSALLPCEMCPRSMKFYATSVSTAELLDSNRCIYFFFFVFSLFFLLPQKMGQSSFSVGCSSLSVFNICHVFLLVTVCLDIFPLHLTLIHCILTVSVGSWLAFQVCPHFLVEPVEEIVAL